MQGKKLWPEVLPDSTKLSVVEAGWDENCNQDSHPLRSHSLFLLDPLQKAADWSQREEYSKMQKLCFKVSMSSNVKNQKLCFKLSQWVCTDRCIILYTSFHRAIFVSTCSTWIWSFNPCRKSHGRRLHIAPKVKLAPIASVTYGQQKSCLPLGCSDPKPQNEKRINLAMLANQHYHQLGSATHHHDQWLLLQLLHP